MDGAPFPIRKSKANKGQASQASNHANGSGKSAAPPKFKKILTLNSLVLISLSFFLVRPWRVVIGRDMKNLACLEPIAPASFVAHQSAASHALTTC